MSGLFKQHLSVAATLDTSSTSDCFCSYAVLPVTYAATHSTGCPANIVTGGGAGSSLLRDPAQLHSVVAAMVAAVGDEVPVSVKMRSGFLDTGMFRDNLLAVQEAGAAFVTLHPRTKQQGYGGRADWSLIALAKQVLSIPVVRRHVPDLGSLHGARCLLCCSVQCRLTGSDACSAW